LSNQLYAPEATIDARSRVSSRTDHPSCPGAGIQHALMSARTVISGSKPKRKPPMRFSAGDRINVLVFGAPEFSGDYVIGADGTITVPYSGTVLAEGTTGEELTRLIQQAYMRAGVFSADGARITVRTVQFAPVNITVSGAVFMPGRHAIGGIKDSDKSDRVLNRFGDSPMERFVPAALRAAGGVRPDADISAIRLVRNGKETRLDWRGAITGAPVDDLGLVEGDHIQVDESPCFQSALVRPSQITPPGIRVVYSNLSAPAYSNAGTIQSHLFAGSVPYGTRLLQGAVQANCVGGSLATNARRHIVLISRNPRTQETEVIQRSVEDLVRSADRDTINPFLMPDDAIACYDSDVSEFKEVISLLQAALAPVSTATGIFKALQ
jgi:protein involved in polysaccharide export with SLBB domain